MLQQIIPRQTNSQLINIITCPKALPWEYSISNLALVSQTMHNPDTATIMAEWRGFYAGETVSTFLSLEMQPLQVGHWGLAMIHHDLLRVDHQPCSLSILQLRLGSRVDLIQINPELVRFVLSDQGTL
jgi:hypothetical protein